MSNANLLIILLTFFPLALANGAEAIGEAPVQEVIQFQPHMLDHPFKGCPTNSLCAEALGIKRLNWLQALQKPKASAAEAYRRKNGMPIKIWSRDKVLKDPGLITWDSFCSKHNPKPNSEGLINTAEKIYISEVFVKNLLEIGTRYKEGPQVLLNRLYLLDNKKVVSYLIPRAEAPLYIHKKNLYFTIEEEGSYFGLRVSPTGGLKVVETSLPKNFPDEIKCPDSLAKAFKDGITNPKLYEGFYCKALWDKGRKKYTTMAIGWSCN